MKQVLCVRFGSPAEAVELREVETPKPAAGEALVEMIAAPVNPADLLLLTGRHFAKPELPAAVGIEGVGRVLETDAAVTAVAAGDLVAVPFGGTWRETMTFNADALLPLPADIDPLQGAMLSVNPFTAAGLLEGLQAGDWVIQNAANSAVGQLVIRLAARRGIRTINIVRRAELVPELEALGADAVLVGDDDLPARAGAVTGGAPIVRALDAVAGEAAGRLHQSLGDGGELVCYGLLNSDQVILSAATVVFRPLTVRGYSRLRLLGAMSAARRGAIIDELTGLLRAGILHSAVEQVYPLDDVRAAVAHAERPGRTGKILLRLKQ